MKEFIEIRDTSEYAGFSHTEVIKTKSLIKMFKGEGDCGETIHFVFYDEAIGQQREFIAAYPNTITRDIAFSHYEAELDVAFSTKKAI